MRLALAGCADKTGRSSAAPVGAILQCKRSKPRSEREGSVMLRRWRGDTPPRPSDAPHCHCHWGWCCTTAARLPL